mmetsp:Transcript_10530/g.13962  ORF Transcript_10530/g.13962 Transcript_10530/m.13962 type:complete len:151 (-) Transcript_10530:934-1386(-)
MIRSVSSTMASRRLLSLRPNSRRPFSSSPLEGDVGPLSTRVHHGVMLGLAVMTPIYFILPDNVTDGALGKAFGMFMTLNITAHSHIGLNYVATDYVPKISKALLGPSRIAIAGLSGITLIGMSVICFSSPGGLKGAVKGVWNPLPEKKKD